MKHIYFAFRTISTAVALNLSIAQAQAPTTITSSNQCTIIEDFNNSSAGFRSSSIYSESNNTQFNWDQQNGYWIETSGLADRTASIISGVYENKQPSGNLVIGFKYQVPAQSEYRIRVINVNCTCTGGNDIIANTANGPVWTPLPDLSGNMCIKLLDNDIIKGQHLRFEISIRTTIIGNFVLDDFSLLDIEEATPLPVTFLGMKADRNENMVNLKWDVAEEINVKEYQVEKSTTGSAFTSEGVVAASKQSSYYFSTAAPSTGTVFYRIKSVDWNGATKYSTIMRLNGSSSYATSMKLYPTLVHDDATLAHRKLDAQAKITIMTLEGKVLKTISPVKGASHTPINLSNIPKGLYLIKLEDSLGGIETSKFIKQ